MAARFSKIVMALSVCLGLAATVHAQDSMSLTQVIAYAWEHNSELLRTQYDAQLKDINLTRTKASILPSVNGQANHNYNFGRTIDPTTNQFVNQQTRSNYFSLNAQITIFDGLRQLNAVREAQWSKDASNFTLQKKKDDIALSVANQYLQIMLLNERKNQLKTLVDNSRLNRDKTNILVKAGSLAEVRSMEAEAQLATDEANLIDIENQIDKAYLSLKQFINYDVSKPLKIQQLIVRVPNVEYTQADLDVVIGDRLKDLPGVQSARNAKESALYGVKLAFGNISPKLSAGASLSTAYSSNYKNFSYYPNPKPQIVGYVASDSSLVYTQGFLTTASDIPFGQQLKNNFGQSIGLSLQVPIFNGLQNHYNIQSARMALNNATLVLSEAENQAKNDVYSAYEGMRMAKKKMDASNLKLKSQQAVFTQANNTYQLGLSNYYDWSLAQNALSNAQSDALQARYEYIFQVKVFEYYLGKPVEF